jgi:hypothetical protein
MQRKEFNIPGNICEALNNNWTPAMVFIRYECLKTLLMVSMET